MLTIPRKVLRSQDNRTGFAWIRDTDSAFILVARSDSECFSKFRCENSKSASQFFPRNTSPAPTLDCRNPYTWINGLRWEGWHVVTATAWTVWCTCCLLQCGGGRSGRWGQHQPWCAAHGTFRYFELCSICLRDGLVCSKHTTNPWQTNKHKQHNLWRFLLYRSLTEPSSIE
jgi:hypothetical protein